MRVVIIDRPLDDIILGKYIAQKSEHRALHGETVTLGFYRQNIHLQHIAGLSTIDVNRAGQGMYASKTEGFQVG